MPDGIFERGAVYSIFAWEALAGAALLAWRPAAAAPARGSRLGAVAG